MIVLISILCIAAVCFIAEYMLYRFVFGHPVKKRSNSHCIPESNLYKPYRDTMLDVVKESETIPHEELSIRSYDGIRLYGRYYAMKNDAPLVIFFHGYHGVSAWDGYGFFKICRNNGINLLMIDERAHGKSESDIITFGLKERHDCKLWTEYAIKRFGENTDIILAGVSMGAASVLMASELGFPQNVRYIISDCGYSEPAAIIKETIKMMKLPVKPLYYFVNLGAKLFGHFDLEETTAVNAVKKVKIPVLFIHGRCDNIVPVYMCEELYQNCAGRKEMVLIEGANHANSAMTDYAAYEKAVMEFVGKIIYKNT